MLLASHPHLVEELRAARRLGISYKRWLGWQPTFEDPIEWDETEREWFLALQEYEHGILCPLCGMPTEFCHDEQKVNQQFEGSEVEICFVTEMRERAMKRYADSGTVNYPHSQTTKMRART